VAVHRPAAVIDARSQAARAGYAGALDGAADLKERVARLAEIRSREGYMAEWRTDGKGYRLIENHCPICAAATECQGFCRTELELSSWALGPDVSVARTEHIIDGARRCVYRFESSECAGGARAFRQAPPPLKRRRNNRKKLDLRRGRTDK
jgi:predicted ArsR family transcriptional regulator